MVPTTIPQKLSCFCCELLVKDKEIPKQTVATPVIIKQLANQLIQPLIAKNNAEPGPNPNNPPKARRC